MKRSDLRLPVFQKRKPWGYRTVSDDDLRTMAAELLPILKPELREQGWFRLVDLDPILAYSAERHGIIPSIAFEALGDELHELLAEMGYVKLDGVDTEALADATRHASIATGEHERLWRFAKKYLEALEGETE